MIRQRKSSRPAVAAIELALVTAGILIPLMFGVWEIGRMIQVKQIMANSAREGARLASQGYTIDSSGTPTQVFATSAGGPINVSRHGVSIPQFNGAHATGVFRRDDNVHVYVDQWFDRSCHRQSDDKYSLTPDRPLCWNQGPTVLSEGFGSLVQGSLGQRGSHQPDQPDGDGAVGNVAR